VLSFDTDKAGENATLYWTRNLPNTIHFRPYGYKDFNDMHTRGGNVHTRITNLLVSFEIDVAAPAIPIIEAPAKPHEVAVEEPKAPADFGC
jgi:hypothetical protein